MISNIILDFNIEICINTIYNFILKEKLSKPQVLADLEYSIQKFHERLESQEKQVRQTEAVKQINKELTDRRKAREEKEDRGRDLRNLRLARQKAAATMKNNQDTSKISE